MNLNDLNLLPKQAAYESFFACCGSENWALNMVAGRPYTSTEQMIEVATNLWYNVCSEKDWLSAFTQHPKIGDLASLQKKFASTSHLAGAEQSGVLAAETKTLQNLAQANEDYESANGFIFIVCATGKSATEMLGLLRERLSHQTTVELRIAMGEQHKISLIRLQKWLVQADWSGLKISQLTTHVLDTSAGVTGKNITIRLQDQLQDGTWQTFALGQTNHDGRIPDLLPPNRNLPAKTYRLVFDTAQYFQSRQQETFYPEVEIQFTIRDDAHYHVPLLLNPFGYSTYRGS